MTGDGVLNPAHRVALLDWLACAAGPGRRGPTDPGLTMSEVRSYS